MIWVFHFWHFLWNSNWKEVARPLEKAKKEKLKAKKTDGENESKKWKEYSCIEFKVVSGNQWK